MHDCNLYIHKKHKGRVFVRVVDLASRMKKLKAFQELLIEKEVKAILSG
jgi:hypothetical protein